MTTQELWKRHAGSKGTLNLTYNIMTEEEFTAAIAEAIEGGHLQTLVSLSECDPQGRVHERPAAKQ